MIINHIACEKDNGKRLADVLSENFGMSRLLIKKMRLYGTVRVNNNFHRMIDPVYSNDNIILTFNEPEHKEPTNIDERNGIKILFSDEYIIVMSKPSGIVTHPTSTHQCNTLLDNFNDIKLHPVSRLDRETSGIIVMARNPHCHYRLSLQHQEKSIIKKYVAINHGFFPFPVGNIIAPIKRKPDSIMLRCVSPDGDEAITEFSELTRFENLNTSVNEFILKTGRTHQIRVHSLFCNTPVIGDGLYGASSHDNGHYQKSSFLDSEISRQALHACYVSFLHPMTGERIEISDPIPDDMQNLIKLMETHENKI